MKKPDKRRLPTGARNLDALCSGGLLRGSVVVLAGAPGAGKTILAQQICFQDASPRARVLYFNTLSEPTAKTLRYLRPFSFFDAAKVGDAIQFVDLGSIARASGLEAASKLVMEHVRRAKPSIIVIDSFKAFDDLARSHEELRKFGYELTVQLMAWEATTLLLGEYGPHDIETNPLFSIIDGLITMSQREQSGEQQRFLQIVKMRGTAHSRDEHTFRISDDGIEVFAPRLLIRRDEQAVIEPRCRTGVSRLDDLLGDGIPRGSSLLVAGVAGTGKTLLLLEFLYRGALAGEKGILFSFEETEPRLRASARGIGWALDREIERGMIEIVFIPQPEIQVEAHLLLMRERVAAIGARRVAVDSISVFLHKIEEPQLAREKTFQLATVVQNAGAVGFFATDIPYGTGQISRFGVEETVVDGVILLSATQEGLERQRYLEVYKLRNTAHLKGRHSMTIGPDGITVYPRFEVEPTTREPPASLVSTRRLSTGIAGFDEMLHGGLLEHSVSLISGSPGTGKSTLALQFLLAGARVGERGLYVALEESPAQIVETAGSLELPVDAIDRGEISLLFLSRERTRPNQFLALLSDEIRARGVRRVVIDSAGHLANEGMTDEQLRNLIYALASRFKSLGVTTMLTLESAELYATGQVTDRHFSPLADNLVMLRYAEGAGGVESTIRVIKTRATPHDLSPRTYTIGAGGVAVARRAPSRPNKPRRGRSKR